MALQLSTPNFGLLQNIPAQSKPELFGQAQQAAAQSALANSQAKATQADTKIKQLQVINQLAGSVALAPPEQQSNAYSAALAQAQSAGIDTSAFPAQYDDKAKALVNAAYYNSDTALKWYSAQAEMGLKQATLGLQYQGNQINAADKAAQLNAQGYPVPAAVANVANSPNPLLGGSGPGLSNFAPNAGPVSGASMAPSGYTPVSNSATPAGISNSIAPAANLEGQKTQVQDWAKMRQQYADQAKAATQSTPDVDTAEYAMKNTTIPTNPVLGKLIGEFDPNGQLLVKAGNRMVSGMIRSLAGTGNRVMQSELGMWMRSVPNPSNFPQTNEHMVDVAKMANQMAINENGALDKLDKMGIKDPAAARTILDDAYAKMNAFDKKTGNVDFNKLNKYNDYLSKAIGDYGKDKSSNLSSSKTPTTFISPTGKSYTQDDIENTAKQYGLNPNQVMQQLNLKTKTDTSESQSSLDPQKATMIAQLSQGIANNESGGSKNPYAAIGVPTNGGRALGKYQVMSANVPTWTKEALGKALTPAQFLSNPDAQEAVFSYKMSQYLDKYGNPQDAISAWFSGRPLKGNRSKDALGTSVPDYVSRAMQFVQT